MADWILNEFMKMFDNVLGWIVKSLGGLWGGLIEIFLEALIDGAKRTLSDIVHGLLSGLVNEVTEGIAAVAWIPEWVKYGLTTFAANVGEALGTIADGAITMVAEGAAEILVVTNAQEQYMSQLQIALNTEMTAMLGRIEASQTATIQVEEEVVEVVYDYVGQRVESATFEVEEFLRVAQVMPATRLKELTDLASSQLRATRETLQESERVARDLAERGLVGASLFIEEMALKYPERYMNDLQETIVKPAMEAEAIYWGFSEAMKIDEDDLTAQLEAQFTAVLRLAAKMGQDPTALELHKEPFR